MNKTILAVIIVLVVILVGVGGYFIGNSMASSGQDSKKLQDAKDMMKEQSADIKKMGEAMDASGKMMQELGVKYKDDALVSSGKDMTAVAEKFMKDDEKRNAKDSSMK